MICNNEIYTSHIEFPSARAIAVTVGQLYPLLKIKGTDKFYIVNRQWIYTTLFSFFKRQVRKNDLILSEFWWEIP